MLKALLSVIAAKGGAKMVTQNHEYIHAEFKTALFGFVDDVEFYLPENEKLIHYRSASRVGTWDLFQNDLRMKRLKKRLRKKGLELT